MLTLHSTTAQRDCSGLSRRDFLRIGSLGLGALSLPSLLRARATAAETGAVIRDKSIVLVFLGGGASHIETFNPNMNAPAPYRSVTGEVATTIPGVTLGGKVQLGELGQLLPTLAKQYDLRDAVFLAELRLDELLAIGVVEPAIRSAQMFDRSLVHRRREHERREDDEGAEGGHRGGPTRSRRTWCRCPWCPPGSAWRRTSRGTWRSRRFGGRLRYA